MEEFLTKIDKNKVLYQFKDGFKFSVDAILLFNFIKIEKKSNVLEIGTGTGIMPVLLSENNKILNYDAIEIQKINCDILKKNINLNNFNFKINVINTDIKKYKIYNKYDIILSNPPFMTLDGKKISENNHKKISRHEIFLSLEDFIFISKKLLKPVGKIVFVHRMHRMIEIIKLLDKYNFNISRIRYVKKDDNFQNIILIEAFKGRKEILKIEDVNI